MAETLLQTAQNPKPYPKSQVTKEIDEPLVDKFESPATTASRRYAGADRAVKISFRKSQGDVGRQLILIVLPCCGFQHHLLAVRPTEWKPLNRPESRTASADLARTAPWKPTSVRQSQNRELHSERRGLSRMWAAPNQPQGRGDLILSTTR